MQRHSYSHQIDTSNQVSPSVVTPPPTSSPILSPQMSPEPQIRQSTSTSSTSAENSFMTGPSFSSDETKPTVQYSYPSPQTTHSLPHNNNGQMMHQYPRLQQFPQPQQHQQQSPSNSRLVIIILT